MNETHTAASRTRYLKSVLKEAGWPAKVRSDPASHSAQVSFIFSDEDLESIATYLGGYLGEQATAKHCEGFVLVAWTTV